MYTPMGSETVSADFLREGQELPPSSSPFYTEEEMVSVRVAQVDFTVQTSKNNTSLAQSLLGGGKEDTPAAVSSQWILFYEIKTVQKEGESDYTLLHIWRVMRPASYDLMKRAQSGVTEYEEKQHQDALQDSLIERNEEGKAIGVQDGDFFWLSNDVGFEARMIDKAMSQEFRVLYKTTDGGETYEEVGPLPSHWGLSCYGFLSEDIGFFSYPAIEGEAVNFYRTGDGGKTYEQVAFPKIQVEQGGFTFEPFTEPLTPFINEGVYTLYLAQGADGDYKGGKCMAVLTSDDEGRTWTYTGKLADPPAEPG